ncbi:DNA-binding protein [Ammoniphilus oxalaticus]|uniref:RNA-binding protein KhpB n=1 Tax=Ammoniphilus oxalaticus TaxID=66863 RepID=A0A419SGK9_9BACL|nr:RNA-binding cell elongation regulator Jag/EloR [Ammoniphilus oxalaticus]RKD22875.1 DNA-binding protein [Ammoniphilus oxalaticus]
MKKVTVTAKTVDEAISLALEQLRAARDQVTVTVLEEPTRGFFGFGARQAKLEVEIQVDPIQEAKSFLEQILATMDIEASISVKEVKDHARFEVVGEDLGIIIGRRGQTLDALQLLVNTVGNRCSDSYLRIVVDAENYREKRKQTLEQLADRLAQKAIKTGQVIKLEPMPAHERKVIHAALQNKKSVVTYSEGEDPERFIVITTKKR